MKLSPRACAELLEEIKRHTAVQVKALAKSLGVCLGYDGRTKDGSARAIVAWLRANCDEWEARELVSDESLYGKAEE